VRAATNNISGSDSQSNSFGFSLFITSPPKKWTVNEQSDGASYTLANGSSGGEPEDQKRLCFLGCSCFFLGTFFFVK
jgi:hypothetical protein